MERISEVHTIAEFYNNSALFIKNLQQTHTTLILTEDGNPEIVIQDARTYQKLLDSAARLEEPEGIRQGLEDVENGKVYPAKSVLNEFRRTYEIPD